MTIQDRELHSILAGLRLLQTMRPILHHLDGGAITDIATNLDTCEPLSDEEIDELCKVSTSTEAKRIAHFPPPGEAPLARFLRPWRLPNDPIASENEQHERRLVRRLRVRFTGRDAGVAG